MGTVTNLADFRNRQQGAAPPPKTVTKEDVAKGVIATFSKLLGPVKDVKNQTAIQLIAATAARAIVKRIKENGDTVGSFSRFQFFGVKDGTEFCLIGRVNGVCTPDILGFRPEMFLIDPVTQTAFGISATSNIAKNNTFSTLITLPMTDFYNL
jgi:hypothetical protein